MSPGRTRCNCSSTRRDRRVTNVQITGVPGPTTCSAEAGQCVRRARPRWSSLTISLHDLPARDAANFPNDVAILAAVAADPGNYLLVGDANGIIAIEQIIVINDPVVDGQPATATIQLVFANPLPDDRFTLTIKDAIVDPAGNHLDGESNAAEPNGAPTFPSGDGVPGGDFVGPLHRRQPAGDRRDRATRSMSTSTATSRTIRPGSGDMTNRDLIFQLGLESDAYFAGNFAPADAGRRPGSTSWASSVSIRSWANTVSCWISTTTACRIFLDRAGPDHEWPAGGR